MLGQIYSELADDKNALENYELANKIEPDNYYNLKALLYLYVKLNDEKANETAKVFFNLAPENPTIYNDLGKIYYDNEKVDDLITFYTSQITVFKSQEKVQGNLNFYLSSIYLDSNKKLAKEYLLKAKDIFSRIYDKDNQVFGAIDDGLERCKE